MNEHEAVKKVEKSIRIDLFLDERREDPTRADGIAGDSGCRCLQGDHFRESYQSMLRRYIGRLLNRSH